MRATVEMRTAGGWRPYPMRTGETLWLSADGEQREPDGADLCVVAGGAAIWAITRPGCCAQSRGRPVMAGLIDLLEAPLTLDGATWTARADEHGPQPTVAGAPGRCPVCHLPVDAGAQVMACGCGVTTDSLFCATGGAAEPRCFACGAAVRGGAGP